MGNFKKNPEQPFEVKVPNKIRKRIAMYEKHSPVPNIIEPLIATASSRFANAFKPTTKKIRGSMWSRFTGWVKGGCK